MKCFYYKDRLYTRILPSKRLFNSTTIYEVVNRGDVFALCLEDMRFTVIPGKLSPVFFDVQLSGNFQDALQMPLFPEKLPSQKNPSKASIRLPTATEMLDL